VPVRAYEVMMILDPGLEEDALRAEVDRAAELVRSRSGNPVRVDRWGRRRLAYEVGKHREGHYVLLEARSEPAVMDELDRVLRVADRVLRHKVVRVPERPSRRSARPSPAPVGGDSGPAPIAASNVAGGNGTATAESAT
jgi:small subunit ribosomal protein S6